MRLFVVFFIFLSMVTVSQTQAQTHVQNLSCYYLEGERRFEDLWIIDANEMLVSFWNTKDNKFQKFSITKLDKKTVAWNQMENELTVFVLDKITMRQSGTIISTTSDGQTSIEKRWFSNCNFISHDQLEDFIQTKQ